MTVYGPTCGLCGCWIGFSNGTYQTECPNCKIPVFFDNNANKHIAGMYAQIAALQAELAAYRKAETEKKLVWLTHALGTPLFEEWPKGSGKITPFFVIGQVDSSIITCNQGLKDVLLIGTDEVNLTEEAARAALEKEGS